MKRKSLLFLLLFALIAPWAANAQETLTVYESETGTNNYIPIYGLWADANQQSEFIIPATELEDLANGTISQMTFHLSQQANKVWNGTAQVYLREVSETAFSTMSYYGLSGSELVYNGALDAYTSNEMVVPFNSTYTYDGGNLLVGFIWTTGGNYGSASFYGKTGATDASICHYGSNSPASQSFIPRTTFTYTPGAAPTCAKPTNLAVSYEGSIATATWEGEASLYNIEINGETQFGVTSPYPFAIEPNTTYTVKVQADCGGGDLSGWTTAPSFTTPCAAFALPYTYDFEDEGDLNCWTIIYTANTPGINTTYANSGTNSFRFSSYSSASSYDQYLISPEFNATTGMDVSFYYKPYSYGTEMFSVGYSTTTNETSAFTWVEDFVTTAGDDWTLVEETFPAGTKYVGIYYYSNYAYYLFVDDFTFDTPPTCPKPKNLVATNPTGHTVELSWTEVGSATAWQIMLDGDEDNLIPAPTNPFVLTGLDPETRYTVQVRAYCDATDQSVWSDEVTFTTDVACPAPTALTVVPVDPNSVNVSWEGSANGYEMEYAVLGGGAGGTITYEFEEDLQGWTNLIVNDEGGQWLHSNDNPGGYIDPTATDNPYYPDLAHGGTGFAMCYSYIDYDGPYDTDAYLVSPMMYSLNAGASLNFWYDMANDDYPEYFEVCVATAANPTAADFTAIWSWSEDKAMRDPSRKVPMSRNNNVRHINNTRYDNWREVTVDLSAYVGQSIWIALHDVNYDAYEVWIDDVTVNAGASGEITWIPVGTVTSPYLLDGLQEGTSYLLRVRAVCGGIDGESVWVNTNFTTPTFCDAPFALNVPFETLMPTTATLKWTGYQDGFEIRYRIPQVALFEEGFENGIPSTWTTIDNDTTTLNNWLALSDIPSTYSYYAEMDLSGWAHSGSNAATSPSYANGVGAYATDQYLVTPQLTLNGTLIFYAASTYYDEFEVLLSTTTNDMSAFTTTLRPMTAVSTNSGWDKVTIDLSDYAGQQGYIAIHHVFADGYFLIIDDFGLYEIAGDDDWITVSTDAQFVDIEDLDPETEYEWQVRGEHRGCTNGEEEGYTPWSTMGTFTTPGLCDPFARITIDTVTSTSVTLSWLGYQESYNVRYRTPADADEVFYDDFSEYEDIDGDDYITLADTDWTGSNLNDDEEQPSDIYSLSFTDGTSMTVFGFAGNGEDQYLISPEFEVENAGILEFYYLAYQASTQTFQVGFSSTDNALTSFTWSEAFTNGSEDYEDYYQIEVPAGTKYFAIKSSGESSLLLLGEFYVGDNYVPASEWIVFEGVTDNPYTITGLTPNTLYQVQIQGNCTETTTTDWYGGYFVTPDAQIIALAQGSNWFSTNREITLANLQTALRTALPNAANRSIKITSQNSGYSQNLGNNWNGQLRTLDVAQMYMITVPAACEIMLEGTPVDPAEHPVNIVVGSNWIGFPLQEEMTLNNAFAGFGTAGDIVKSQTNGQATKRGNAWMGQLKNLVPGKGYIYNASATGTLTFPSNTSKGAKTSSLSQTSRLNHDKVFSVPTSLTKVKK